MKKLRYILGFVICMHFIVGCKEKMIASKENQESLELRIADVLVVDNTTSKPLMMTNGYEIHPAEGITYPRLIEKPLPSNDSGTLRFRMSWITDTEDTKTITIKADGYEPKTLSLDQVLRINNDKMTSKHHAVELRMRPLPAVHIPLD